MRSPAMGANHLDHPKKKSTSGHLYMRDTATGETVKLDAAQGVAGPPELGSAQFQTASSDGSRVFFTDKQRLRRLHGRRRRAPARPDLYECEMVEEGGKLACHLRDLTVDHNPGEHAAVQGFLFGASKDGTSIYLVAQGVLAGNENGNDETARAGQGQPVCAALSTGAHGRRRSSRRSRTKTAPSGKADTREHRVSDGAGLANGRYLAFMSAASLTGYDNVDAHSGQRRRGGLPLRRAAARACLRLLQPERRAPAGRVRHRTNPVKVSGCWSTVARSGPSRAHWLAGNIPGWTAQNLDERAVSIPLSVRRRPAVLQQPRRSRAAGHQRQGERLRVRAVRGRQMRKQLGRLRVADVLGISGKESAFIEATPDGNNVFFVTAEQLVPQDTDTAFDIYDARVCSAASRASPTAAKRRRGAARRMPVALPRSPAGAAGAVGHGDAERAGQRSPRRSQTRSRAAAKGPSRSHPPGPRSSRKR